MHKETKKAFLKLYKASRVIKHVNSSLLVYKIGWEQYMYSKENLFCLMVFNWECAVLYGREFGSRSIRDFAYWPRRAGWSKKEKGPVDGTCWTYHNLTRKARINDVNPSGGLPVIGRSAVSRTPGAYTPWWGALNLPVAQGITAEMGLRFSTNFSYTFKSFYAALHLLSSVIAA
jgi:hypothetical protein